MTIQDEVDRRLRRFLLVVLAMLVLGMAALAPLAIALKAGIVPAECHKNERE